MPGLSKEVKALELREDWSLDKACAAGHNMYAAAPTDSTPTKDDIHNAIRTAGKTVPRYLFRAWNRLSGGRAALNTTEAVTPLAFLRPHSAPSDIFDMDAGNLLGVIKSHMNNASRTTTVFSSWSHSLAVVMSIATAASQQLQDGTTHVSIIDTHQLREENYIFYCGAKVLEHVGIPIFAEEFLVFGVVSGEDAYKAVPYQSFGQRLWDFRRREVPALSSENHRAMMLPGQLKHTKAIAKLFGPRFELMILTYLLAHLYHPAQKVGVLRAMLAEMEFPSA